MKIDDQKISRSLDRVALIAGYLQEDNDVLRCAAARALGAIGDEKAAPTLVASLHDEDPDVRTDVMAALVACGRPSDAEAIRLSLIGDPVKEVKISAIKTLCRLKDEASFPLFRTLVKDRSEQDIAWEDGVGLWDDWLDVQLAAIDAIGELGDTEAVDILLEARTDDMGQDLDHNVFAALTRIPDGGLAALINLLQNGVERERKGALIALSNAGGHIPNSMAEDLAQDANPDIRRLAIENLDYMSELVAALALRDPDVSVRRAALTAFASLRIDISEAALSDSDETVRALALAAIVKCGERTGSTALAANVETWMGSSKAYLAATCAEVLPKLCGVAAETALTRLVVSADRPLEARIAALRALISIDSKEAIETILKAVLDQTIQIRLAAITALSELVRTGSDESRAAAREILIRAIQGDISRAAAADHVTEIEKISDIGASKVEDISSSGIRITRDGDIVPVADVAGHSEDGLENNVIEHPFPRSTLQAIQEPQSNVSDLSDSPGMDDENTPGNPEKAKGRRRRVPVDGPDEFGIDLRATALRVSSDCIGQDIEESFLMALGDQNPIIRAAAIETLARRSDSHELSDDIISQLSAALDDEDPSIRGHAARALLNCGGAVKDGLAAYLHDPDALVRAIAIKSVKTSAPDKVLLGLRDGSSFVRRSALECILEHGDATLLEDGLRICMEEGWVDSLSKAIKLNEIAGDILNAFLDSGDTTSRQTQSILEAIATGRVSPSEDIQISELVAS